MPTEQQRHLARRILAPFQDLARPQVFVTEHQLTALAAVLHAFLTAGMGANGNAVVRSNPLDVLLVVLDILQLHAAGLTAADLEELVAERAVVVAKWLAAVDAAPARYIAASAPQESPTHRAGTARDRHANRPSNSGQCVVVSLFCQTVPVSGVS